MSLLLLASCLLYGLVNSQTNPAQKNALISFFKSTNGEEWIRKWDLNTDPCKDNWFGIKCAGPNIYALSLQKNRLSGTVPIALANLTFLQFLYLSQNKIQGTFPDIFTPIKSSLMQLGLDENGFTGQIPRSLGLCINLQNLFLQKNYFTGPIDFLGDLSNLQISYLSHNKFDGTIPQGLAFVTTLQQIGLDDNQLTGTIPKGFVVKQNNLVSFFAQTNNLTGSFDDNFCGVQNCDFSENLFECPVPNCCKVSCSK